MPVLGPGLGPPSVSVVRMSREQPALQQERPCSGSKWPLRSPQVLLAPPEQPHDHLLAPGSPRQAPKEGEEELPQVPSCGYWAALALEEQEVHIARQSSWGKCRLF